MPDDNVTKQHRWKQTKLHDYEDLIVWKHQNNVSLRSIQSSLREKGVTASISTISGFIKNLPAARLQRRYEPFDSDRYGRRQAKNQLQVSR